MNSLSLTEADINAMMAVNIKEGDRSTLRDIRDVEINTELPKRERMLDFISQIGNPYCYRHGSYMVKVSFTDTDATLEERMLSYIRSKCWQKNALASVESVKIHSLHWVGNYHREHRNNENDTMENRRNAWK